MSRPDPKDKRCIKLVVEYDGTDYHGWQVQPGTPTIQGELEKAVEKVTGGWSRVVGAGRTDAGVHARAQTAHFVTSSRLPAEKIGKALNGVLPPDIAVLEAREADKSFHARYSARRKRYRYTVLNRAVRGVLDRRRALWVSEPLDVGAMAAAARCLAGTHDFSSFACNAGRDDDPVRTVTDISVAKEGEFVVIEVEAESFLYKMVRSIAGTLIDAGRGKLAIADVERILDARDRCRAGATAPARGLCLIRIDY